jgi:epoxide hydrolase-like predicted phosphatase
LSPAPAAGLILDFGGVLWNMRWDVCRELEDAHGLERGLVFSTLYRTETWRAIERGRGDPDAWRAEAHHALEARAGRPLPPLHDAWRAAQGPIAATADLVRALRPRYRLGILSNADRTLRARLRTGLPIYDLFDDVVCSAEVGLAKPEPEIYVLACERLGLPPGACVFVDDHEPNITAAEAVGLRAVLYRVDRGDDLGGQLAVVGVTPAG